MEYYRREQYDILKKRLQEDDGLIQIIAGPRQVGKTTMVRKILGELKFRNLSVSAEDNTNPSVDWIRNVWETARATRDLNHEKHFILVIDEIHKIPGWSNAVKSEWDRDIRNDRKMKVVILGSSELQVIKGADESLAGRFELIRMNHWSGKEMKEAFGMDTDKFIFFGGYPGLNMFTDNFLRWQKLMRDSIIAPALENDILKIDKKYTEKQIRKPALLRRLFEIGSAYSGQIVSWTKILGQLQDKGNVTTLQYYLDLLQDNKMLAGIYQYSDSVLVSRKSSPKLLAFDTSLLNAYSNADFETLRTDTEAWGRMVESAVGAHLLNFAEDNGYSVFYWRDKVKKTGSNGNKDITAEVDYVLEKNGITIAIEVKSGRSMKCSGMDDFQRIFKPERSIYVGTGGIPLETFLSTNPADLFDGIKNPKQFNEALINDADLQAILKTRHKAQFELDKLDRQIKEKTGKSYSEIVSALSENINKGID